MIPYSHIQVNCHADDWKQAIEMAAKPLVDDNDIDKEYIQNMIEIAYEFGPYLIIAPHFALIHGAPGCYIHENSISIATFENDIYLENAKEPVRIMMCVACYSQMSYIHVLGSVARQLMKDHMINKLMMCQSKKELYKLFDDENE